MDAFPLKTVLIFLDGFIGAKEAERIIKAYSEDKYDTIVSYDGDYAVELYSYYEKQQILCGEILIIAGIMLLIALSVNLFIVVLYDIKRKGIFFGVLKAQGMTNKDIYFIIFIELAACYAAAAVLGTVASAIIMELIAKITASALYVELTLDFLSYLSIGLCVFGGGLVLLSLFSFILLRAHIKQNVVKLL
jgi:hypothetical protein